MLELQNLCRNFRGIPAIEGVSFKVAPGEIVGFAQLVKQQDTRSIAQEIVAVMQLDHA